MLKRKPKKNRRCKVKKAPASERIVGFMARTAAKATTGSRATIVRLSEVAVRDYTAEADSNYEPE